MNTLEEKIKKNKKNKLIGIGVCYLVGLTYALQICRAYLYIKSTGAKILINDVLNLANKNISNNFLFLPSGEEYKKIFMLVTILFVIWALTVIIDDKKYMKGEEHGSAKWASKVEKEKFKDKKNLDNNTILSEDIQMSLNNRVTKRNQNMLIIGGPGSGKTFQFMLPNLLQKNGSYIINDVKGELLVNTGKFFKDNGYKVKVLNIKDMKNTMHYNPFKYVKDENDILKFIRCLMDNTEEDSKKGEAFWRLSEQALLTAIIAYLMQECRVEDQTLVNVMEMLRWCDVSEEDENAKSILDCVFEELEEQKGETLAVKQYKIFKKAAGKTAKSILISAMSRLGFLDLTDCKEMFSHQDEFEFENLGQEKTALYIVNSDTDNTYNFILGIAYSQMLDTLCKQVDAGNRNKYHVHFMMDEFANGAKIPNFTSILTVVRSRNISCKIIIQSITQLKKMYEKDWGIIVDSTDSKVFLGAGFDSCKWLSEQLGKMTIDSKLNNRTLGRNGNTSENYSILGRNLFDPDELMKLDNSYCVCLIRGCNPMLSLKYKTQNNKRFKYAGDIDNPNNKNNFYYIAKHKEYKNEEKEEEIENKEIDDINNECEEFIDKLS